MGEEREEKNTSSAIDVESFLWWNSLRASLMKSKCSFFLSLEKAWSIFSICDGNTVSVYGVKVCSSLVEAIKISFKQKEIVNVCSASSNKKSWIALKVVWSGIIHKITSMAAMECLPRFIAITTVCGKCFGAMSMFKIHYSTGSGKNSKHLHVGPSLWSSIFKWWKRHAHQRAMCNDKSTIIFFLLDTIEEIDTKSEEEKKKWASN